MSAEFVIKGVRVECPQCRTEFPMAGSDLMIMTRLVGTGYTPDYEASIETARSEQCPGCNGYIDEFVFEERE